MRNLNDPFITNQAKQHELQLATNQDLLERTIKEAGKGNIVSFPSYWVVENQDLLKFAFAAENIGTIFQLETSQLERIFPESNVLLFESDRIEAGEWDYFNRRFAPFSTQLVYAVLINGIFGGFTEESIAFARFDDPTLASLKNFPNTQTLIRKGTPILPLGLLEIPFEQLTSYEDKRVHERSWDFSKQFVESMNWVLTDLLEKEKSKPRQRKSKKKRKGFGK
jgi:hypothetical protein